MSFDSSPKPKSDFALLNEHPTPQLWLIELKKCITGEGARDVAIQHLGSLGEYCVDLISRRAVNPDASRSALIPAIDQLLQEYNPEKIQADKKLCYMLLDLIEVLVPPSGFEWAAEMLTALGVPEAELPRQTGGEDTRLQALHASEKYFLRRPNEADPIQGHRKRVLVAQPPERLSAYMEILDQYAESPDPWYAGYAQEVRAELTAAIAAKPAQQGSGS
jgi:hypothetical protein